MKSSGRAIAAILIVAVLAIGFWMALLGPKRQEADELSGEVDNLKVSLAQAQGNVAAAEAARKEFPENYRQLVALGEAVPEGDETASLLVELNRIAENTKVSFQSIQLSGEGEGSAPEAVAPPPAEPVAPESPDGAVPAAATVPPTEAAASLMPLGASIGPAGLAVMPYTLTFSGSFFEIADFIDGVDTLVETENAKVGVEGRLVTIDGFSLTAGDSEEPGNQLNASFVVTTYVTPPEQGITAGASPTEPAPVATPTASSGESPEEPEAGGAQ
jgi:Tfp pilus assembly protein PilO